MPWRQILSRWSHKILKEVLITQKYLITCWKSPKSCIISKGVGISQEKYQTAEHALIVANTEQIRKNIFLCLVPCTLWYHSCVICTADLRLNMVFFPYVSSSLSMKLVVLHYRVFLLADSDVKDASVYTVHWKGKVPIEDKHTVSTSASQQSNKWEKSTF